ncbi:MAG: LytTR family transcriptional regulator [Firmicutes bacterium]|jgi:DNA-binding LytR/AlgR family response regulator|nr:LytTR family transcriptional regulator [Bacillota bacterium]
MTPIEYIPLITKKYNMKIPVEQIVYFHQQSRKLKIVTDERTYEYYGKLETLTPRLDKRFYAAMQSITINLDKVVRMEDQAIYFDNGETIFLGRCNYIKAKQSYAAWLRQLI